MASAEVKTIEVEKMVVEKEPVVVLTLTSDEASLLTAILGNLNVETSHKEVYSSAILGALKNKSRRWYGSFVKDGKVIAVPTFEVWGELEEGPV